MKEDYVNGRIASYFYDGVFVPLVPAGMRRVSETEFEREEPDGLCAMLTLEQPEGSEFYACLSFENRGLADSRQITFPRSLDLALPHAGKGASWHSLTGDSCGANSFNPLDRDMKPGEALHVEPQEGRPSNTTGFPFFDLTCGPTYVFGIGWSGQWTEDIDVSQSEIRVQIGLADADFYLRPGEKVRLCSALCVSGPAPGAARRSFRRVMMKSFSPAARHDVTLPTSLQPFDRYFYNPRFASYRNGRPDWATEDGQKRTADAAEKCRWIDTLWLDAAWFRDGFPSGVGNYSFEKGFPNGLKPVTDYVHGKNMRFVLWFEPERVDIHSEVFRDHSDMLLSREKNGDNRLFNLADGRARDWLKKTLIDFIRDNGIDIYRQDFNIDPLPYWRANDQPGRRGLTEIAYVAGHYDLWDALTAAFPNLLIDNCASGGRRIDLETCRRAVPLWRSDTGCFRVSDERRGHTWNQNHILALTEYIPFHACATWETETYFIRSAESGGLACEFDALNPAFDFDGVAERLHELRRVQDYWKGDFYPLTRPDNSEKIWAAWQLDRDNAGVIYAFRRDECDQADQTLSIQAIDPAAEYELSITDEQMNTQTSRVIGSSLASLTVHIGSPRESVLIEYRKI